MTAAEVLVCPKLSRESTRMADRPTVIQVRFRLREATLNRLRRAAKAADRSMNEELEYLIERAFAKDDVRQVIEQTAKTVLSSTREEREKELTRWLHEPDPKVRFEATVGTIWDRTEELEERLQRIEQSMLERKSSREG